MSNTAKQKISNLGRITALAAAAVLALTACNGEDVADPDDDEEVADPGNGEGPADPDTDDVDDTIEIAINHGWEEGIAVAELWALVLEDEGYDVETTYMELGPSFEALSNGDVDFNMNIWQPITHSEYLQEYEEDMEQIGVWNADAVQAIAVNEDVPVDSLEELADNADLFDNELVGIEPDAGLTQRTEEIVIPEYELEDWEFTTSSTEEMLEAVDTATEAGDNIAVTLWIPHWAFETYDIKALDDPLEALGQEESMTIYAREGFTDDQPEIYQWLESFEMDTETLIDLEEDLFVEDVAQEDYPEVVRSWMEENQEYVDSLTS